MFKNILRTFEAEVLNYLRTFVLSPKIKRSFYKKSVSIMSGIFGIAFIQFN